jgi:LysR family carnitine catabolism transcriptional activator
MDIDGLAGLGQVQRRDGTGIAPLKTPRATTAGPALRIEIVDLETFLAVATLGSFSAAAKQLNITQPSVTSRIQRLEAALGARLLVRTTRKVELTRRGTLLQAEADRTLAGLRRLVDRFRLDATAARRRIVVAATQMVAAKMLPDVVRSHGERHPDIEVKVRDLHHGDALQAVETGDADVAVLAMEGQDKRFRSRPLRTEDMVLLVPARHPLARTGRAALDDLAAYPLMLLEIYSGMKAHITRELARHGLKLRPAVSASNLNTLLGMLDAGMGVLLLPRVMAERSRHARLAVVEIEGIVLRRAYCIVTPRDVAPTAALRRFCRHLQQELSAKAHS